MSKPKFGPNDKVFAKVRGYPPWPARVEGLADETPNKMKYHVFFYGTRETAVCKAEDIFDFHENEAKYSKSVKRKFYAEALEEIAADMSEPGKKFKTGASSSSADQKADNDNTDTEGELVIDEDADKGKQATSKKRKASLNSSSSEPESKKIKRQSLPVAKKINNTESTPTEPNSGVKVVSRSGRKIKPKKFLYEPGSESVNDSNTSGALSAPAETKGRKSISKPANENSALNSNLDKPVGKMITAEVESVEGDLITANTPDGKKIRVNRNSVKETPTPKAKITITDSSIVNLDKLKETNLGAIYNQFKTEIDKVSKNNQEGPRVKLEFLKTEAQLLDIDCRIKTSLSLAKANPNECLRALDELLELKLDPLMLKKHPEVVETSKKLKKYIGNIHKWDMSDSEKEIFAVKSAAIRSKSEHVYNKFKSLFTIPSGVSFWQTFTSELEEFNKKTNRMPLDDIFGLTEADAQPAETVKQEN